MIVKRNQTKKSQSGFTLVEMVVAVGLFSIVSVVIAQLFVSFSQTQQRSTVQQRLQSDARVMMTQIADIIRASTIDYPAYGGTAAYPEEILFLVDEDERQIILAKSGTVADCPSPESTPCLVISENGSDFAPLSSDHFTVDTVNFYISPATDPVEPSGPNEQPRVTFSLGMKSVALNPAQQAVTYLQSTASSREYVK